MTTTPQKKKQLAELDSKYAAKIAEREIGLKGEIDDALHAGDMEKAGVNIGLGVDGSASNDESNLMQEVRAAFLLQRARYGVGRVSHKDALRWATKGSAACVGRPELGEIAVGKAADLALFKLDELRFSGHGDPIAALVLCGAHRADRVMIAGNWKVADGRPIGIDVAKLRAEHGLAARAFLTNI